MSIGGINFSTALAEFSKAQQTFDKAADSVPKFKRPETSFQDTLNSSLKEVNEMQGVKTQMIKSFATGENQNVHELMITLQKAGLAVNMTSAVRNKVLEAYKELSRITF